MSPYLCSAVLRHAAHAGNVMRQIEMRRLDMRVYLDQARSLLEADRVVAMSLRPGPIERIVPIDLARPRALEGRAQPGCTVAHEIITEIFLARGVLRSKPSPISPSMQE